MSQIEVEGNKEENHISKKIFSLFTNNQRVDNHYEVSSPSSSEFPVMGQGTVSVNASYVKEMLQISLSDKNNNAIGIDINQQYLRLWLKTGVNIVELSQSNDPELLLNPSDTNLPYWLSLDSNNKRIRYGKGEMLRSLMLYEYSWLNEIKSPLNTISKSLQIIQIKGPVAEEVKILEIPVNLDPSPHVVSSDNVTLEALADNSVSVIADLPNACQLLYANIAGPKVNLSPDDFPEFAQAIQYSINTPDGLCNKKLQEKDPIFGYLRVTIDSNLGDSPGQPYVLEIWPAGNGSPIHNHGEACAVIKVLHGQIKVSWFSALSPEITRAWGSTIAHAGEITFLSPNYYQIHQLFNPSPKVGGDFCATIQCYRYPDDNTRHYEYFDYIEDGTIKQFMPDSDWTYLEFKSLIRQEWDTAMQKSI
jgi:hypothetical protein